jgi:radical SAM superfamily enzyme YgiQ (UPF0313 family)
LKVTFISPYSDITAFGVRSIAAFVKRAGFEVRLIFLPDQGFDSKAASGSIYRFSDSTLKQTIELCGDSHLIGISLFTCHFDRAVQLTKALRSRLDTPLMWGGIHPTIKPDESLQHCDMVCMGEGEDAVTELLRKMKNKENYLHTNNFWFKHNGGIIKNELRPLKEDLNSLPFPDYSTENSYIWDKHLNKIIPLDASALERFLFKDPLSKKPSYMTMTTRGCPHRCSYCMSFRGMYEGQKYLRRRSPDHVVEELERMVKKYNFIEGVQISDDSFFVLTTDEMKTFSKLYKEKIGLPFRCLGSPSTITEEKLSYVVDAGLYEIQMGIETACDRTRKLYRRTTTNETVLQAAKNINKFKKSVTAIYDFILDNPYETKEDIAETLKFILKIPRPFHLQLFSLIFFPGTELYTIAKRDGIITDEEKDVYRKQFQFIQIRYLNLIFYLFNYGVPNFLIKLLLNRYMIKIFERESISKILQKIVTVIKYIKRWKPSFSSSELILKKKAGESCSHSISSTQSK